LGIVTGKEELAARKLVSDLRKFVIAILSAHTQRVLSNDPRVVVNSLKILIVDRKRAAGRVAKAAQIVAERNVRNSPRALVGDFYRNIDLGIDVFFACQLLTNHVEDRVVSEAGFVDASR